MKSFETGNFSTDKEQSDFQEENVQVEKELDLPSKFKKLEAKEKSILGGDDSDEEVPQLSEIKKKLSKAVASITAGFMMIAAVPGSVTAKESTSMPEKSEISQIHEGDQAVKINIDKAGNSVENINVITGKLLELKRVNASFGKIAKKFINSSSLFLIQSNYDSAEDVKSSFLNDIGGEFEEFASSLTEYSTLLKEINKDCSELNGEERDLILSNYKSVSKVLEYIEDGEFEAEIKNIKTVVFAHYSQAKRVYKSKL